MTTRNEINIKLNDMATKLEDTADAAKWTSGQAQDAIKVVIPMIQDMLDIMKDIMVEVARHQHFDQSGGR